MIELADLLTILGIAIGLFAQAMGVIKWMNAKIDSKHLEYHNDLSNAHRRIDKVRDEYVKRVDLDRDLTNIYGMLNSIKDDIKDQTNSMNVRLDKLLDVFAKTRD
jgi:hypothetical protein